MNATGVHGLNILVLTTDPKWSEAARNAVAARNGQVEVVATPAEALKQLVSPTRRFSHFLLEPSAAGEMMPDLLGVTAAEAGSPTELVLLGAALDRPPLPASYSAVTPEALAETLSGAGRRAGRPARMSASELAVVFEPSNVDVRFQPIVQLSDRRPVGVEALARLHDPDRGTIGPDSFVPQIEQAGLSLRLTEAVANGAMESLSAAFLNEHDLFMTINLPLDVLLFPESLSRIEQYRRARALPTSRLLIELTESRPVSDIPSLAAAVNRWRGAGYRLAIDDMGPEMMNQLELFSLPFNVVKLDKQIVIQSETDPLARSYLQKTVDKAHSRGLSIIAEGIENQAMWVHMRDMGVQHAQGFLIARALPAAALPVWLEAWNAQLRLPADRS